MHQLTLRLQLLMGPRKFEIHLLLDRSGTIEESNRLLKLALARYLYQGALSPFRICNDGAPDGLRPVRWPTRVLVFAHFRA